MKYIINLVLILLIAMLGYFIYTSISEPINFNNHKAEREALVIDRLRQIRTAQELYREITGKFAPDFDALLDTLRTKPIPIVKIIGDPDAVNRVEEIQKEIIYINTLDSLATLNITLDSLPLIPNAGGKTFSIQADEIEVQRTRVNVVEVGARYKDFMGYYADERFQKYDKFYSPNKMVKFGDLTTPTLAGNWE